MKQILNTLRDMRRGKFVDQLDKCMREATDAVRDAAQTGRKATAKVTISFTLTSHDGDALALTVADKIDMTLPKEPGGSSIFFAGADGALVRSDPRQVELPLRDVNSTEARSN
jgi:hypothetical protein